MLYCIISKQLTYSCKKTDDGEWMLAETFFKRYMLYFYNVNHESSVFSLLMKLLPQSKIFN